jgi:hypothetical protein
MVSNAAGCVYGFTYPYYDMMIINGQFTGMKFEGFIIGGCYVFNFRFFRGLINIDGKVRYILYHISNWGPISIVDRPVNLSWIYDHPHPGITPDRDMFQPAWRTNIWLDWPLQSAEIRFEDLDRTYFFCRKGALIFKDGRWHDVPVPGMEDSRYFHGSYYLTNITRIRDDIDPSTHTVEEIHEMVDITYQPSFD